MIKLKKQPSKENLKIFEEVLKSCEWYEDDETTKQIVLKALEKKDEIFKKGI